MRAGRWSRRNGDPVARQVLEAVYARSPRRRSGDRRRGTGGRDLRCPRARRISLNRRDVDLARQQQLQVFTWCPPFRRRRDGYCAPPALRVLGNGRSVSSKCLTCPRARHPLTTRTSVPLLNQSTIAAAVASQTSQYQNQTISNPAGEHPGNTPFQSCSQAEYKCARYRSLRTASPGGRLISGRSPGRLHSLPGRRPICGP